MVRAPHNHRFQIKYLACEVERHDLAPTSGDQLGSTCDSEMEDGASLGRVPLRDDVTVFLDDART